MQHPPRLPAATYTRRRLLALVTVAAPAGLVAWRTGRRPAAVIGSLAATTTPATTIPAATAPAATTATSPSAPTAPSASLTPAAPEDRLVHELRHGMAGDDVARLQTRLRELRFDPGPPDGLFGGATLRAVWAFEKIILGASLDELTGVVTAATWARMQQPGTPAPRRTVAGTHVEVDLPRQFAGIYRDGSPLVLTHVSTGAGSDWCDEVTVDNDDGTTTTKGICGRAVTPGGLYHVERKVAGWRNAPLGRLYQPIYFNFGIAIHGATNVPDRPASRGCVRVPLHIAEYLPGLLAVGDPVYVFDGVDEPEHYGAQPPVFDWPDPNYIPPSTRTITTTTASSTTPAGT